MNREALVKLIKFGLIGFSGLLLDFGATFFLKEILLFNKYMSNSFGFVLAASSNFILNRFWTFKSQNNFLKEYLMFISIALIGLTINSLIILFLNDFSNFEFYFSKFVAVVVVFLWNFIMNSKFNFKSE